ncbi:hypothetical protein B0H16DRAFT_171974 [Mycena metata]|uniref:Uncharacterized protein n=1 Tax=Mycena metata TaxID=1033252 RepID=A0AAD7I1N4_9AGAR|nr:hypothetical protein B0H16DRAFT_171974 [Mycena metata]
MHNCVRNSRGPFRQPLKSENTVTIHKPLSTVFTVLGTDNGLDRGILLSSLASDFQTLEKDTVAVAGPLEDAFVRTTIGVPDGLPRQSFQFKETVKIIPGVSFMNVEVNMKGTLTWDESRNVALYETTNGAPFSSRKSGDSKKSTGPPRFLRVSTGNVPRSKDSLCNSQLPKLIGHT